MSQDDPQNQTTLNQPLQALREQTLQRFRNGLRGGQQSMTDWHNCEALPPLAERKLSATWEASAGSRHLQRRIKNPAVAKVKPNLCSRA